jgi:hypothetical protein
MPVWIKIGNFSQNATREFLDKIWTWRALPVLGLDKNWVPWVQKIFKLQMLTQKSAHLPLDGFQRFSYIFVGKSWNRRCQEQIAHRQCRRCGKKNPTKIFMLYPKFG